MGVCWVTAEFAVGFGGAETPQISAVTQQISHGNHDIFKVTGWLATANLAGNIGTPDFDVLPGRLCGQQISERLLGNSWIMNLWNYKGEREPRYHGHCYVYDCNALLFILRKQSDTASAAKKTKVSNGSAFI